MKLNILDLGKPQKGENLTVAKVVLVLVIVALVMLMAWCGSKLTAPPKWKINSTDHR